MPDDRLAGCAKSLKSLIYLLRSDLWRYEGKAGPAAFLKHYLVTPGYTYTVWMRLCGYLKTRPATRRTLYIPAKWILLRLRVKYGIVIPEDTIIGPGFFINRFGGIYIHGDSIIGKNVNVTHGTVLARTNRGTLMGAPIIGDRVFFAAGCKVIGRVTLGDDSVVGVNAVVTKDLPPMGVAAGIPAKILSMKGSDGYINKQWQDRQPA